MSENYKFSKDEYINKDNNIPTLPPHRIVSAPRAPGEPSALQRLAAFAAAVTAENRLMGKRKFDDDSDSDSCYGDSDFDDDDYNDDYYDDYDFFGSSLPYRMRTTSLPAAIEGQKTAEIAQAMLRKLWTPNVSRGSINSLASSNLSLDN
ncbi:unnamed protein product [Ceratitis capitata]|uniref:(Mediterranean fruit fly) hypothetical protein n=1 Tax=Ceratitis capitata TaxID=7213 RepID=A0A811U7Y8_CERCA|nr:unnamed protein product [Ceratitis capitata]